MKMVIAYVQVYQAEKVVKALQAIPELPGATIVEVRGFGRGRGKVDADALATSNTQAGTLRKMRIETMVPAALVDRVVRAIREAACTGNRGDGKIYVTGLDRAVRIRTNEEGEAAL